MADYIVGSDKKVGKQIRKSIIDICFDNGFKIYVFPSLAKPNIIELKYSKNKNRTVLKVDSIEWEKELSEICKSDMSNGDALLDYLKVCWNNCTPLSNLDYYSFKSYVKKWIDNIPVSINSNSVYSTEFLVAFISLIALIEKTNNASTRISGKFAILTAGKTIVTIKKKPVTSILDIDLLSGYSLHVFPGALSPNDILIKYQYNTKGKRTPKHVHWVVDLLIKRENKKKLTRDFILKLQEIWEYINPLSDNKTDTLIEYVDSTLPDNFQVFLPLDKYGEYPVEMVLVLTSLLAVQEKTNKEDAYMFGDVIKALLAPDLDIFHIISKAGYNGRYERF